MPPDLVVKKALNSRSASSAEIPTPQSVTLTSTRCVSSWPDRITSSRGRSVTGCHGLNAVHHQIDDHLLQLDPIAEDRRQGRRQLRFASDILWLTNSRCTSAMTSLIASLMSSGTFSISVFFASARTRRIDLARPNAIVDDPFHRAARLRPGRAPRGRANADSLGVGDHGGERLVHFMGDRGCQFAQRRHARDMREFRLRLVQRFLGRLAAVTSTTAPMNSSWSA